MEHKVNCIRRFLVLLAVLAAVCTLSFVLAHKQVEKLAYPQKYQEYVTYYADKYDLDPLILYTFIRTESNFDSKAQSDVDARGLMQITEVTFDWIKSNIAPTEALTFEDMYVPETNIRFGAYLIKYCLLRYQGDLSTAAAAYHSGWGTVDALLEDSRYSENGKTLTVYPYPQMRHYVRKITQGYQRYQKIYSQI